MAMSRQSRSWTIGVAAATAIVYAATIVLGLRIRDFSWFDLFKSAGQPRTAWTPPRRSDLPHGALGESIRRGEKIFNETPLYAAKYTGARISCGSCHAEGGIQPFASPVVGAPAAYPAYSQRAGHVISLEDRIQECFVRSENGQPLPYSGPEMHALVDYIAWLSRPQPGRRPYTGRGLAALGALPANPQRGGEIYATQCAGCHGEHGEGRLPLFPALWGPDSFNAGAGMHGIPKMAAFVQHNMPQNRMGILSAQDAFDVAAYIHAQPRPPFNPAFSKY